ncbi:MAG: two pore domain potassium channel family protein, partial [Muribaculaceae bacterium]|nr:two pore domain potassium channel family protein [Muribaculaceae bacterium]
MLDTLRTVVLVLSVILIVYISVDSIRDRDFLKNHDYMVFQFWVCVVFIIDFFVELWIADRKLDYIRHRWYFLLLSIPYLNLLPYTGWLVTQEELYFFRFIPLARGAMALSIV